jgi:hypothetical protein
MAPRHLAGRHRFFGPSPASFLALIHIHPCHR